MASIKQPCDPVNHPAHYTDGPAPFIGLEIGDPEPFTEDMIRAAEECEEAEQDEN